MKAHEPVTDMIEVVAPPQGLHLRTSRLRGLLDKHYTSMVYDWSMVEAP